MLVAMPTTSLVARSSSVSLTDAEVSRISTRVGVGL